MNIDLCALSIENGDLQIHGIAFDLFVLNLNMFKKSLILICTVASFLSIRSQDAHSMEEIVALSPTLLPSDALDIYNQEAAQAGYLPAQKFANLVSLKMMSTYISGGAQLNKTAIYTKASNSLEILIQGKTTASKIIYRINQREWTKMVYKVEDGKDIPVMKERKIADDKGRVIQKENYFFNDTGWVNMSNETIGYKLMKNGLLLEMNKKGAMGVVDSIWYYYDDKGKLIKKANLMNRWNVTYTEIGNIKTIAHVQKSVFGASETTYNTTFNYNEKGQLLNKTVEDKYFDIEYRFVYNSAGKITIKTIKKQGSDEVKEINSFTYDNKGILLAVGQTVEGKTSVKASVKCDADGNVVVLNGTQFPTVTSLQFKDGQGSSSISTEGVGKIEIKIIAEKAP